MKRIVPWIPILGIFLAPPLSRKYGEDALWKNLTEATLSGAWQAVCVLVPVVLSIVKHAR